MLEAFQDVYFFLKASHLASDNCKFVCSWLRTNHGKFLFVFLFFTISVSITSAVFECLTIHLSSAEVMQTTDTFKVDKPGFRVRLVEPDLPLPCRLLKSFLLLKLQI